MFFFGTKKEPKDICVINHPRKVLNDGYYECIYTDELVKKLSDSIVLERPYQMQHLEPSGIKEVQKLDILTFERMVYYRLYTIVFKKRYTNLVKKITERICRPLLEIGERYGIDINHTKIVKYIADQIIYYKANHKTVEKIIKAIKPKIFLEVVAYSFECMLFTEVCKKNKIPVIELQHGILTNHIAYNLDTQEAVDQIPDKILLFSDFWKQHMKWPGGEQSMVSAGYPYFEKKVKAAKKIKEFEDKKNIIFISQGTIGKKLCKLARMLAGKIDGHKYRILYKLHPGEYAIFREQYPELEHENIVVLQDNTYGLYDCFISSMAQVGVYSTAIYEGLGFGLATYIYQIEMAENMLDLCHAGYAKYVKDSNQLYSYIEEPARTNQGENFWKENAMETMLSVVLNEI